MAENPLPDGTPEVASIRIAVGLDERGVGEGYSFEGMSRAEALGRLLSVTEAIKAEMRLDWEDHIDADSDEDDEFDEDTVLAVCPHCDTPITRGEMENG